MSGASSKICNTFWYCISPLKIILDSLKIILRNKRIFILIFISLSLPLSLLTLSLSLSTHPLLSQIYHLEAVALLAPTRFEARHVWQESRSDAIHLLRIKALFSLPTFFLSLTTAITAVHASVQSHNNKTQTLTLTLRSAVKQNWKQPSITAIFIYAILLAFAPIQRIFLITTPSSELRFLGFVIGSCFEVYLMAVLGLGLVVSISEERFGWEAIKVGWGLMAGRRLCGMVLTGFFVVVSGLIRRRMVEEEEVAVVGGRVSSGEGKMVIVCLYAVVVVWSYVVMTVFYCDCRRRHGIKEVEDEEDEGTGISNSML